VSDSCVSDSESVTESENSVYTNLSHKSSLKAAVKKAAEAETVVSDPDRCYKLLDDLNTGEEDFMRKPLQVSLVSIIEQIEK